MNDEEWPALSYAEWAPTKKTLHMVAQMLGKARLALAPPAAEWLGTCLYLDPKHVFSCIRSVDMLTCVRREERKERHMAKITIEAATPEELLVFVRKWLDGREGRPVSESAGGDAEKIRTAIRRMYGPVSRRFLRDVAEAAQRGERVTVDADLASRYEVKDGGSLGGAIGNAASGLHQAVGRWVLDRVGRYPSVWTMSSADAEAVLAALDERA
jgi:hypothetical protein